MEQKGSNLASTLCTRGCGFYGNPAFEGMCSKCYKDTIKRSQLDPSPTMLSPVSTSLTAIETNSESTSAAIGCSMSSLSPKSSQVSVKTAKSTLSSAASSNSYRSAEDATKSGTSLSDLEEQQQQDCAACASSQTELKDSATNSTTTTTTSVLRHSGTCSQSVETASTTIPTVSKASSKHSEQANDDLCSPAIASTSDSPTSSSLPAESEKKPKKNRCHVCKKKVGLTGFECRCGGLYCGLHRYPDKHDCTFDYKELAQEEIRKANPVVIGEKVAKI